MLIKVAVATGGGGDCGDGSSCGGSNGEVGDDAGGV